MLMPRDRPPMACIFGRCGGVPARKPHRLGLASVSPRRPCARHVGGVLGHRHVATGALLYVASSRTAKGCRLRRRSRSARFATDGHRSPTPRVHSPGARLLPLTHTGRRPRSASLAMSKRGLPVSKQPSRARLLRFKVDRGAPPSSLFVLAAIPEVPMPGAGTPIERKSGWVHTAAQALATAAVWRMISNVSSRRRRDGQRRWQSTETPSSLGFVSSGKGAATFAPPR